VHSRRGARDRHRRPAQARGIHRREPTPTPTARTRCAVRPTATGRSSRRSSTVTGSRSSAPSMPGWTPTARCGTTSAISTNSWLCDCGSPTSACCGATNGRHSAIRVGGSSWPQPPSPAPTRRTGGAANRDSTTSVGRERSVHAEAASGAGVLPGRSRSQWLTKGFRAPSRREDPLLASRGDRVSGCCAAQPTGSCANRSGESTARLSCRWIG